MKKMEKITMFRQIINNKLNDNKKGSSETNNEMGGGHIKNTNTDRNMKNVVIF